MELLSLSRPPLRVARENSKLCLLLRTNFASFAKRSKRKMLRLGHRHNCGSDWLAQNNLKLQLSIWQNAGN